MQQPGRTEMNMTTVKMLVLALICSGAAVNGQNQKAPLQTDLRSEELAGQLEETAMCHHAIKAAQHDALALGQNPYYRYVVNSPQKGGGANVYPIPERCKNLETAWILRYTNMGSEAKSIEDKTIHDEVGMTISEMATDAQFLAVVINKMEIEGDKAVFWENRDKDIP
jgi:hypothetical protein